MEKFDICVIGGGPAGYAAAMRAIDYGKRTLIIEMDRIGGAGLYNGALSSKTLWELSKDVASVREKMRRFGQPADFQVSYQEVKHALWEAVQERAQQLEGHLDKLASSEYGALLTQIKGRGKMTGPNTVLIEKKDGSTEEISAEYIIVATGSRPRKLPNVEVDEQIIFTSDGIEHIPKLPRNMVILGAGVIGCEYATIFSNFGKTKVYLIDKQPRILPFEDDDVVDIVEENLVRNGVVVHRQSELIRMEIVDGEVEYELESTSNGSREVFRVEKALVAVGRVPNTENLGLEELGIKIGVRGQIEDDDTTTPCDSVRAVGDVTADISLVNVGELEGRHAVKRITDPKHINTIRYEAVNTIMFLNPEVAAVGRNEKQCQKEGLNYKVVCVGYGSIPRAIAMRATKGFFKIIVTDDEHMHVLGMRAVGPQASSAIQAVAVLMSKGMGIEALAEVIYPHPSLTEGVKEAGRMLLGKPILKPHLFKDLMVCRCWRDGQFHDLYNSIPVRTTT